MQEIQSFERPNAIGYGTWVFLMLLQIVIFGLVLALMLVW